MGRNRYKKEEKIMEHITYLKKQKKGLDLETILVTFVVAFAAAIGILATFAVLTGADIYQWEKEKMLGVYLIVSGSIWGGLLIDELCKHKQQ